MGTVTVPGNRTIRYPALQECRTSVSAVHETAGAPKPSLLDRVREVVRARHYSRRTEKADVAWTRRSVLFHGKRHPMEMGGPEVTKLPSSLATEGNVAPSTQKQALSALLFLYRDVLRQELPWLDEVVRPRRPRDRPATAPPPARVGAAACRQGRRPPSRHPQASHMPHAPPFLRHAPARGRPRHPDGAGAAGHRDVATTQIYAHVLNQGPAGVRSPADHLGL
jgi:hypothetical protein